MELCCVDSWMQRQTSLFLLVSLLQLNQKFHVSVESPIAVPALRDAEVRFV